MTLSQGTRAISAVAAAFLLMLSIGSLYAWSVFVTPLESQIGASRSAGSAVFSLAILTFTLAMLFGARLYRWLSAVQMALLSGLLAAAGFALAGLGAGSILVIGLGFGGLFGLANGLGYGLSLHLVQQAWPHRRGLLTGLAVAAYTLGSAAFSGLFAWGLSALGLAGTFLATAAYMVAVGAIAAVLVALSGVRLVAPNAPDRMLGKPLRDPHFWTLWLGFFFSAFAGVLVLGHAAAIVGVFDVRTGQMALGAALVAIGNGVGRLSGGWLSDHRAPRGFLSALLLLAAASLLTLLILPSAIVALIALTLMGFGYGSVAGSFPAIVSKIYGAANVSVAFGRIFTAWGVAGLSGPLVGGLLFDWSGSYDLSIAAALGSVFCASLVCRAIRLPQCEEAPKV